MLIKELMLVSVNKHTSDSYSFYWGVPQRDIGEIGFNPKMTKVEYKSNMNRKEVKECAKEHSGADFSESSTCTLGFFLSELLQTKLKSSTSLL